MSALRWIFGGFFALVGLTIIAFATATMITAGDSRTWPQVEGTMVVSEVESRRTTDRGTSTSYTPKVAYRYEVAGDGHEGTRFELIERGEATRTAIEAKLDKFPLGARVAVYYDPDDPRESVLKPGPPAAMGIPFALGFVALLVGGGIVLFMRPAQQPYERGSRGRGKISP